MGYQQDRLAGFFMNMAPRMLELIHLTNKRGYFITRGKVRGNMPVQGPLHRNHVHAAMAGGGYVDTGNLLKNVHYGTFDSGGWLMPGLTYAYNGTGKPERILTNDQWSSMENKGSGATTYNVYPQRATFTIQDLDALTRRQDALQRMGRPA